MRKYAPAFLIAAQQKLKLKLDHKSTTHKSYTNFLNGWTTKPTATRQNHNPQNHNPKQK